MINIKKIIPKLYNICENKCALLFRASAFPFGLIPFKKVLHPYIPPAMD